MGTLTKDTPKPLLPILNCPLLRWSVARLSREVNHISVNVHYLHNAFAWLPDYCRSQNVSVNVVYEPQLTGPFGGVLACQEAMGSAGDLLVFAGDGLYEADFDAIVSRHREQDAELTLGVATVKDGSRYGVVSANSLGRVTHMVEKPHGVGSVTSASCGVYVVSSRLCSRFAGSAEPLDWMDIVKALLQDGALILAAKIDEWHDVGTPGDLLATNLAMLNSDSISSVATEIVTGESSFWYQGLDASRMSGLILDGRVLIGDGADIGPETVLANSIIGTNAKIGRRAQIRNSVVLPGRLVPSGSIVNNMIWS